ncbi:MAG TPA: hypothetical protein DD426_11835 [Clostridiaceae bacterium]|nr:hypothetical protein [Clostridiaceae bacterium]
MKVYNASPLSGNITTNDAGRNEMSKDGFLMLLAAELQHQDPLNAGDSSQYIDQMAQFSTLEELTNLNNSIGTILNSEKFQQGSLMIGKTAMVVNSDGTYDQGIVSSVRLEDREVDIVIGDKEYDVDNVVQLQNEGSGNIAL